MKNRGLTLVEVIITITIAAIVSSPIGIILGRQLDSAMRARDVNVATVLARQELERLDSLNNFFVTPDLDVGTRSAAVPGYPYTRTITVTCLEGNCASAATSSQGVKQITMVVTKTGVASTLARLIAYRTKHVSFGQ